MTLPVALADHVDTSLLAAALQEQLAAGGLLTRVSAAATSPTPAPSPGARRLRQDEEYAAISLLVELVAREGQLSPAAAKERLRDVGWSLNGLTALIQRTVPASLWASGGLQGLMLRVAVALFSQVHTVCAGGYKLAQVQDRALNKPQAEAYCRSEYGHDATLPPADNPRVLKGVATLLTRTPVSRPKTHNSAAAARCLSRSPAGRRAFAPASINVSPLLGSSLPPQLSPVPGSPALQWSAAVWLNTVRGSGGDFVDSSTGAPIPSLPWCPGEPNNKGGSKGCTCMLTACTPGAASAAVNDAPCGQQLRVTCVYVDAWCKGARASARVGCAPQGAAAWIPLTRPPASLCLPTSLSRARLAPLAEQPPPPPPRPPMPPPRPPFVPARPPRSPPPPPVPPPSPPARRAPPARCPRRCRPAPPLRNPPLRRPCRRPAPPPPNPPRPPPPSPKPRPPPRARSPPPSPPPSPAPPPPEQPPLRYLLHEAPADGCGGKVSVGAYYCARRVRESSI
jgi:hypothetical protein